jgi:hypothetical protein
MTLPRPKPGERTVVLTRDEVATLYEIVATLHAYLRRQLARCKVEQDAAAPP